MRGELNGGGWSCRQDGDGLMDDNGVDKNGDSMMEDNNVDNNDDGATDIKLRSSTAPWGGETAFSVASAPSLL